MPFERAHAVMDEVERAARAAHANMDVIVHGEPVESENETLADKVRMVALELGMRAPHNLEVHRIEGRYFIDFDLECPSGQSFVDAHGAAMEMERDIRRRIDGVEKVTIHLEEYQQEEGELREATVQQRALLGRHPARAGRHLQHLGDVPGGRVAIVGRCAPDRGGSGERSVP
jgi:divalent metal cation (Fe/Co/Zn/Cd) transporter